MKMSKEKISEKKISKEDSTEMAVIVIISENVIDYARKAL